MVQQDEFSSLVSVVKRQVFDLSEKTHVEITPAIWSLATMHKVGSIVASYVLQHQPMSPLATQARDYWQKCALREAYYVKRSEDLRVIWQSKGIPSCLLKGVLLAPLYPKRGFRVLRDADLLISPKNMHDVSEDLQVHGYAVLDPLGPLKGAVVNKGNKVMAAELGMDALSFVQDDYFLEIHATILPPIFGTYQWIHDWKTRDAMNELSPEDVLAHLLFHATRHHFLFGLRQLLDVAVWINAKKPDTQLLASSLTGQHLYELAWPAWKLSHEIFPEFVPSPPQSPSTRCIFYTARIRRRLKEIPALSITMAGSPLLCLAMMRGFWKKMVKAVRGGDFAMQYQTGRNADALQKIKWYVFRPFGLIRRHASPIVAIAKFLVR